MDIQIMPDSLSGAAPAITPDGPAATDAQGTVAASPTDGTQAAAVVEDKRLTDTTEALKEAQRQYHEMKGQIAQLSTQVNAPVAAEAKPDFLESEEFLKKFDDDPAAAAKDMILAERDRLATAWGGVLEAQRTEMLDTFKGMLALSPEQQTHTAELTQLSTSVPGFDVLPDETKVQMAKVLRTAKGEEALTPPGSPAGTGYTEAQRNTAEDKRKKNIEALTASWFGPEAVKNSELYPGVSGHGSLQPKGV